MLTSSTAWYIDLQGCLYDCGHLHEDGVLEIATLSDLVARVDGEQSRESSQVLVEQGFARVGVTKYSKMYVEVGFGCSQVQLRLIQGLLQERDWIDLVDITIGNHVYLVDREDFLRENHLHAITRIPAYLIN